MTNAAFAFGSTLQWNSQAVAELTNVGTPTEKADTIDVTSHGSADGFREFLAGLRDGGEIAIEGNFYPGDTNGQIALHTDFQAGTSRAAIVTFPTAMACTWTATCIATAFQAGPAPVDGKVPFTATLKITGKPVLAVTASANITALSGIEQQAGAALTFVPAFAAGTYAYNVAVNTASTWVKLTITQATAVITTTCLGITSTQVTTVQSGAIAIGAADSLTDLTITVKDANKMPKTYTLHISRP